MTFRGPNKLCLVYVFELNSKRIGLGWEIKEIVGKTRDKEQNSHQKLLGITTWIRNGVHCKKAATPLMASQVQEPTSLSELGPRPLSRSPKRKA